ncbi:MAG TPA: alkaline phosphatase family protein, partial [Tepidisphaeraceae bacterium]|nr:alkaline phosphatase family protein [Tepidisphaeraceae bacterium]
FPLFEFWGPMASIESTQWISSAASFLDAHDPTLKLIYLPHLDYDLQRFGPDDSRIDQSLRDLDQVLGALIEACEPARVIVLSEYGIEPVNQPVHINRILRQHGLISIREELGRELLDAGASRAFAVADHQIAHVYVKDQARLEEIESLLRSTPGIEQVLTQSRQREAGIDHPRSGELVAIASPGAWFTYYYWLDDAKAPDFARTVDIHRKPGYDPVELFLNPELTMPKARIAWTLLKRKLGFASLLNVIPLDASLVRGSHGRTPADDESAPVFLTSHAALAQTGRIDPADVCDLILQHVFE